MDINRILQADKRYKEAMKILDNAKSIEDEERRKEEINKISNLIISVAYDKAEIYDILAWQLINSADVLLRASSKLISIVEPQARYKDKFNLSQAKQALNKMIKTFEDASVKINEDYGLHGYTENSDTNVFDAIDQNSRLILAFVMLVYNTISQNGGNAKQIEAYLRRLKGKEIFPIEEIESFKGNF